MPTPSLHIRPATEADLAIIRELICALAEYERLSHVLAASEERLRLTLFGPQPAAEVLLADWEQECAGFAVYFQTYSTFLAQPGIFLEDLFVKPHLRGKGIGRALLARVARIAVDRGCGRMEWEVLDWNEPSIRFYKKLGASPLADWTKYRLTGEALRKAAGRSVAARPRDDLTEPRP
jgi:GNAT superfamily N-acetyltransferase